MKVWSIKNLFTILLFSLLITCSFFATKTMFLSFEVGEISETDIISTKTVTYENEEETNKQKELALSQVQEVYDLDPTVSTKQVDNVKLFFDTVIAYKNDMADMAQGTEDVVIRGVSAEKSVENPYNFTAKEIEIFLAADTSELRQMKEVFAKQVENIYVSGITASKIEDVRKEFKNITIFSLFDSSIRNTFIDKLTVSFEPNMKLNEEATTERKAEALSSVKPNLTTLQKGVKIVGKNEQITQEHIAMMEEAGLVNDKFNFSEAIHKLPFVFLLLFGLHLFMFKFSHRDIQNRRLYLFVFAMTFIVATMSNFFQDPYFSYFLFVTSLIAITTFLSPSVSTVYAIVLALLIYTGDYKFLFLAVVLGMVQTLGHNPEGDRATFLNLGAVMSLVSVSGYVVLNFVMGSAFVISDLYPLALSPILASIFVLGAFKYLENMLGLITSLKLHELDGSKHKLIKRLVNEAPGTFHHSLRVGQLAEAAANAVGANALLLKVGALYHDVGKLEHPRFFIENTTLEENPHNDMEPIQSAAYILQHPIDSVKLCRKHKIPEQIIELIEKHHGDGFVEYFYIKQKELVGEKVNENDFKYKTPPPQTKEEGILMLADVTEAVSRTLENKSREEFKKGITDLIYHKIEEGQLRECELTMREINLIIESFITYLLPSKHERIEYPTEI